MATYKSYSKRKTRTNSDTTASDLFDDFLSSTSTKNGATHENSNQRLKSKPTTVPHAPKECSPPDVDQSAVEETKGTTWSRKRYQYSFSPRAKIPKRSSNKTTPTKVASRMKTDVFDFNESEEENEVKGQMTPTKGQRSQYVKEKSARSITNLMKSAADENFNTNTDESTTDPPSSSSINGVRAKLKRTTQSQPRKRGRVTRSSSRDTEKATADPSSQDSPDDPSLEGSQRFNTLASKKASKKENKPAIVVQDSDLTSHALIAHSSRSHTSTFTSSTKPTTTSAASRNKSASSKNGTKRPRVGDTVLPRGRSKSKGETSTVSSKVISEIATRTRSTTKSVSEEVVKSPLDELLESPVKKPCYDYSPDRFAQCEVPAKDSESPLLSQASSKVVSPAKPKEISNRKVKPKPKESSADLQVPSLKKSSSYPNTLTVPSLTRTSSWPRQYSLLSTHSQTAKAEQSAKASSKSPSKPSTTVTRSPRKYALFHQQSEETPPGEGRAPRQYSYVRGGGSEGVRSRAGETSKSSQEPTRVRNVREAHECLETGENQEFFDDVRYLLGSIKPSSPLKSRCLGTLSLADQFLRPEFSQQLRSQGFTTRVYSLLKDCIQHPPLCLCTAVLFYTLTRDQLNSDWTKEAVDTLVSMLSTSSTTFDPTLDKEMTKLRQKSRVILEKTIAKDGSAQEEQSGSSETEYIPDLDEFTISDLARESLTALTAPYHNQRTLRNHLRTVGALDKLANMAISCSDDVIHLAALSSGNDLDLAVTKNMRTLDRCLKVLENCSLLNKDNQTYLVVFDGSVLVSRLVRLVKSFYNILSTIDSFSLPTQVLLSVFKLLLNLTHENELGCDRVGGEDGVMSVLLYCVLMLPDSLPDGQRFDIMASALGVLINLTENSSSNRKQLESTKVKGQEGEKDEVDELLSVQKDIGFHGDDSSLRALLELFQKHYRKAESASITVPSPQRLSQLSSSPHSSPYQGSQGDRGQGSTAARRNLTSSLASKLKSSRSSNKTNSQNTNSQDSQGSQGSDGMGWLPGNSADSDQSDDEEEEYESIPTDPMVFSREEFDTALHQAGRHLEDSVLASYTALLVGILVKHNTDCVEFVRGCLPSGSFAEMIGMLRKFVSFMNMTGSTTGLDSIRHIIRYLDEL